VKKRQTYPLIEIVIHLGSFRCRIWKCSEIGMRSSSPFKCGESSRHTKGPRILVIIAFQTSTPVPSRMSFPVPSPPSQSMCNTPAHYPIFKSQAPDNARLKRKRLTAVGSLVLESVPCEQEAVNLSITPTPCT